MDKISKRLTNNVNELIDVFMAKKKKQIENDINAIVKEAVKNINDAVATANTSFAHINASSNAIDKIKKVTIQNLKFMKKFGGKF